MIRVVFSLAIASIFVLPAVAQEQFRIHLPHAPVFWGGDVGAGPVPPSIEEPGTVEATLGEFWEFAPKLSSGTARNWSIAPEKPGWMHLDASTGRLSGTPPASGDIGPYVLRAEAGDASDEIVLAFPVRQPLSATIPEQVSIPLGSPLGGIDVQGGDGQYAFEWAEGTIAPSWLQFGNAGAFLGEAELGSWPDLTLEVRDGFGRFAEAKFDLSVVDAGGSWLAWGRNGQGEFGDGTTTRRLAPTPLPAMEGFSTVAGGGSHTCGLKEGKAYCWGSNYSYQLGTGDNIDTTTVPAQGVGGGFVDIGVGQGFTCGLKSDGKAYCWGAAGKVGHAATSPVTTPPSNGVGGGFVKLVVGYAHACGLKSDGKAYCWGDNSSGQLGVGDRQPRQTVLEQGVGSDFVDLYAKGSNTCGLKSDGKAYCWGDNYHGQLGVSMSGGSGSALLAPSATGAGDGFLSLYLSGTHVCGLKSDGKAYCWGYNTDGKLGDGTQNLRSAPPTVGVGGGFVSLMAGDYHTCGLKSDGKAYCWGQNAFGQLGTNSTSGTRVPPTTGVGEGLKALFYTDQGMMARK